MIVATVVGPGCALDKFVEDVFANDVCPPLALAIEHRSVQQFAGYIDVVIGLPYPADLLRWSGKYSCENCRAWMGTGCGYV